MFAKRKKGQLPVREIDEADRKEVHRLLGIEPDSAARVTGPSLFLKVAGGYAAMALFTMAALLFSAYHLYSLNRTAFIIAKVHLPVLSAVSKMRASVIAQEGYAGKYSILKDPAFVQLFRQRDQESRRNLAVLEGVSREKDVQTLERLYLDYQRVAEEFISGRAQSGTEFNSAANGVIDALDAIYVQRQQRLQRVLAGADEQRISTIGWTVVISGIGFLLALAVATVVTLRILKSLRKTAGVAQQAADLDAGAMTRGEHLVGAGPEEGIPARLRELERNNFTTSGETVSSSAEPSQTGGPAHR